MKKREVVVVLLSIIVLGKLLPSELFNILMIALGCLTSVFWLLHNSEINKVLFAAYCIRLLLAFVAYFDVYPIEGSRSDAVFFLEEAERIYAPTIGEIWDNYQANPIDFYPLIIAIIYFIFGKSDFLIVFLNVIFSTLVVRNTYYFTSKIYSRRYGKIASVVVCFLPYSILLGVTLTREPLITFLLTYSFYLLAAEVFSVKKIGLLLLCVVGLSLLHGAFFFFLILILIYFLFSSLFQKGDFRQKIAVFIVSFIVLITGYMIVDSFTLSKLGGAANTEAGQEQIISYLYNNAGAATGDSNYRDRIEISGLNDFVLNTGKVILPFIFQPYLWRIIELKSYFILFLGSIPWHILLYFCVFYFSDFIKILKSKSKFFFLIGGLILIFAFGSFQINQAIRHNHKFIPIMISLLAPIMAKSRILTNQIEG